MPQFADYAEVAATRIERKVPGGTNWRTDFFKPPPGIDDAPMAFISESTGGRVIRTHYHTLDQFHVIVSGDCTLGSHQLDKYAVHFVRAYTPYGDMTASAAGLGFLSMYPRRDAGAHYLPECTDQLKAVAGRAPWQASDAPRFPDCSLTGLQPLPNLQDDQGLAAYVLTVAPGTRARAPNPATTNGQYILVTRGSLVHDARTMGPLSLAYISPDEPCLEIQAGPEGLQALVLHFPREKTAPAAARPAAGASDEYKVWQCELCGFVYDEAAGAPEEGLAPGTRWADVPDTWKCPDCAAFKPDFRMVEIG